VHRNGPLVALVLLEPWLADVVLPIDKNATVGARGTIGGYKSREL
jgi:hypothetical protein